MIMTHNQSQQKLNEQQMSEQKMPENNCGAHGYPNYYQYPHTPQQERYVPRPQQNQDLINLESNNQQQQQLQEQQERREIRQKQEQQFRLSMSSMKNQISEVIKEDLNESQRSNTGRENSVKDINESMQGQDQQFEEDVVGVIENANSEGDKRR